MRDMQNSTILKDSERLGSLRKKQWIQKVDSLLWMLLRNTPSAPQMILKW